MAENLRAHVHPGDVVVAAQVLGEPTALIEEFFRQVGEIPDLRMFVGMSLTEVMAGKPASVSACSFVGMPPNAGLIAAGEMDLVPCQMSALPWLLTEGPLRTDVALIQVGPPDADGFCSLGVISDYAWHAVQAARVVFAEINDYVPVVAGDTRVHLDRIAFSVRTSRALPEYPVAEPSELELGIAAGIGAYIRDGSCVQVGIGKLGEAVLRSIADRRDLGVHAGMIGDTLLELTRSGVVTNARKEVDTGLTVCGSLLGSARAVALAAAEPSLRLMSVSHTHDPARVAALSNFVCVQSALEVDLLGQVNAETAGGRYVGGTGGSVDFLRSAVRSPGGHSIVALPSSASRGRSRIVPRVERVTALGTDVDVFATEYGVAELRGLEAGERARRIIAIAAPEHRGDLLKAAVEAGL